MSIKITRLNAAVHLLAENESGNKIEMDGSPAVGGEGKGFTPMQLLIAGLGGCSSIDVLDILKKQRVLVENYEVHVEGDRRNVEEFSLWDNIHLKFIMYAEVDFHKVQRAVELSLDKYCSVAKTLEPTAKITYSIILNGKSQP